MKDFILTKGSATEESTQKDGTVEVVFTLYLGRQVTKSTLAVNFVATTYANARVTFNLCYRICKFNRKGLYCNCRGKCLRNSLARLLSCQIGKNKHHIIYRKETKSIKK